MNSGFAIASYL